MDSVINGIEELKREVSCNCIICKKRDLFSLQYKKEIEEWEKNNTGKALIKRQVKNILEGNILRI